jgi:hypothetical protein
MNRRMLQTGFGITLALATAGAAADNLKKEDFTEEFADPTDCEALATDTLSGASNRFFPLDVNRSWMLSNMSCVIEGDCDELEEVIITVLPQTENVDGTITRVVEEREATDGALTEISRNFLVECVGTEDLYYFGEDVDIYNDDGTITHEGEWRVGGDNRPGLLVPGGSFLVGARYYQEWAPGIALDRSENQEMGLSFADPAGGPAFEDCVLVEDTNAIEDPKGKDGDEKLYCPGIGLVQDEEMKLTMCTDGLGADCSQ